MTKPYWSAVQAAVWIETRDSALVERIDQRGTISEGSEMLARWRASRNKDVALESGLRLLAEACVSSKIVAVGRMNGANAQPIPARTWPYLKFADGRFGQDVLYAVQGKGRFSFVPRWTDVHFLSVEVRTQWPHPSSQPEEVPRQRARTGRKPIHDWEGAQAELILLANQPDGLPDVQARAEDHIKNWFISRTHDHPAESQIRDMVGKVYQLIAARKRT